MSIAQNFPIVSPALLLDFAAVQALDPRISYARATTATYYGTRTAKAEQNLVTFSQVFQNAVWTDTDNLASVTDNSVVAPDGTTTAATIVENSANTPHLIRSNTGIAISAGLTYTASAYLKAGTRQYGALLFYTASTYKGVVVDLSAGTITLTSGTILGSSITSVGNGWYRVTITDTISASPTFLAICLSDSGTPTLLLGRPTYLGNGTGSIQIWGAQLEQRSTVTAYQVTTTQPVTNYIPVLETAASGVARFDHNPVTFESLGLLIEEQRTNLLTYSEQFDNAAWTKNNATITTNTIVAPDGTLTGDKFVEGTIADAIACARTGLSFTAANTFTGYAKAGENRYVFMRCFASIGNYGNVTFDLQTGVITQTNSVGVVTATGSITNVGNGWYRLSVTVSSTSSVINIIGFVMSNTATPTFNTAGVLATPYTGNGFNGVYLWGAQLEAGAFATSYIPTVASQVTRAADSASMTGTNFSSWYNQAQGTLYVDFVGANPSSAVVGIVSVGANSNYIDIRTGSFLTSVTLNGGTQQTGIPMATYSANTSFRGVTAYQSNDFAAAANGGTVGTDSVGLVPTANTLYLASTIGIIPSSCTIKKIAYYPIRLSNTNLQALTG